MYSYIPIPVHCQVPVVLSKVALGALYPYSPNDTIFKFSRSSTYGSTPMAGRGCYNCQIMPFPQQGFSNGAANDIIVRGRHWMTETEHTISCRGKWRKQPPGVRQWRQAGKVIWWERHLYERIQKTACSYNSWITGLDNEILNTKFISILHISQLEKYYISIAVSGVQKLYFVSFCLVGWKKLIFKAVIMEL